MHLEASELEVEPSGESGGHCDCCGNESRSVCGFVHKRDAGTVACYFMQWTVGASLVDHPANFDVIYGPWGESASNGDRCAISLSYFEHDDGRAVGVIDANNRPIASNELIDSPRCHRSQISARCAAE